jgi:hypothetical protein
LKVVPRSAVVPWRLEGNNVGAGGLSTTMHRKAQDAHFDLLPGSVAGAEVNTS